LGSETAEHGLHLSLLWPAGGPARPDQPLPPGSIHDLGLEALVAEWCPPHPQREAIRSVLYRLCQDPATLAYRQAVLRDMLGRPTLADSLASLQPMLDELLVLASPHAETSLQEVIWRASELQLLVDCVGRLSDSFRSATGGVESLGLRTLQDHVDQLLDDAVFRRLIDDLPALLADLRACASITIGVNLDEHLQPDEAVLLSVNPNPFTESTLLGRFMGKSQAGVTGIAPLHAPPMTTGGNSVITGAPMGGGPTRRADPMLLPLFRDLSRVLEKTTQPIARELRRYVHVSSRFLVDLRPEIIFYVQAAMLARRVESMGLPVCLPEIAPIAARTSEIADCYNLQLALHLSSNLPGQDVGRRVVANDVSLGSDGRIVILTGPNQGGKTTYMQAIGQAQVLAQAGLFVPGKSARISPVDGIYTHYPAEERLELGTGRFGDEARRIRAIFEQVTRRSLVLLNESLSTTNLADSLYLAQDIVRVLRRIGLRAIYTTHLHELAAGVDLLNADTPGDSQIVSMVASYETDHAARTDATATDGSYSYRVIPSPPQGRSYADRIAVRYGIGFDQLISLLGERNVADGEPDSRSDSHAEQPGGHVRSRSAWPFHRGHEAGER
jgi:DNA mismatch repair protein MutS